MTDLRNLEKILVQAIFFGCQKIRAEKRDQQDKCSSFRACIGIFIAVVDHCI
jgi:hypothetical protein